MLQTLLLAAVLSISSPVQASPTLDEPTQEFVQDSGINPELFQYLDMEKIQQASQMASQLADQQAPDLDAMRDEEPVPHEIQLVGRGIVNRRTGESLALSVYHGPTPSAFQVEHECARLRYVYYSPKEKTSTYVGKVYPVSCVSDQATPQEIKAALKPIKKRYQEYNRIAYKNRRHIIWGGISVGALVGTGIVISSIGLTGGTALIALFCVGGAGTAFIGLNNSGVAPFIKQGNTVIDRNGWNWSSKPKKVSSHTFDTYVFAFVSDSNRFYR